MAQIHTNRNQKCTQIISERMDVEFSLLIWSYYYWSLYWVLRNIYKSWLWANLPTKCVLIRLYMCIRDALLPEKQCVQNCVWRLACVSIWIIYSICRTRRCISSIFFYAQLYVWQKCTWISLVVNRRISPRILRWREFRLFLSCQTKNASLVVWCSIHHASYFWELHAHCISKIAAPIPI